MDDIQLLRYSRQILLNNFGIKGQEALLQAKVLIIGLGGLGSAASLYLAAAGVKYLSLVDDDQVDISNLQRQIIHNMDFLKQDKVLSAKNQLLKINPDCQITTYNQKINPSNLSKIFQNIDIVLDCTDNFSSRFLINKACVNTKKPLISGAAIGWEGQLSVFDSNQANSPCYHCLYDEESPEEERNCSNTGIIGPVVGSMGTLQALEAIKVITGIGSPLIGKVLRFDGLYHQWYSVNLKKDPQCKVCKNI